MKRTNIFERMGLAFLAVFGTCLVITAIAATAVLVVQACNDIVKMLH